MGWLRCGAPSTSRWLVAGMCLFSLAGSSCSDAEREHEDREAKCPQVLGDGAPPADARPAEDARSRLPSDAANGLVGDAARGALPPGVCPSLQAYFTSGLVQSAASALDPTLRAGLADSVAIWTGYGVDGVTLVAAGLIGYPWASDPNGSNPGLAFGGLQRDGKAHATWPSESYPVAKAFFDAMTLAAESIVTNTDAGYSSIATTRTSADGRISCTHAVTTYASGTSDEQARCSFTGFLGAAFGVVPCP